MTKKIMVISPSRSLSIVSEKNIDIAKKVLKKNGYDVVLAKNAKKIMKYYNCASIDDRIKDFNEALESDADLILTSIGGYNSNQLLPYLNYEKIKKANKKICGFSDITAVLNAIYAQTGIISFYGPHFSTFGMIHGNEYTIDNFNKILNDKKNTIYCSKYYRDDPWYLNQNEINEIKNDGMFIINKGKAEGVIIGGNLCTLNLLQGTKYMPKADNIILFIEDDGLVGDVFLNEFDRNLESILQSEIGSNIRGIIIGRAQENCNMNLKKWEMMLKNKKSLNDIPVIINADFGHTTPIFTFPIGGYAKVSTEDDIKIEISWE